jgi:ubiquitin-protein ligase
MPLPPEVLRSRLKNEIEACHRQLPHHLEVSDPYLKSFPVSVSVSLLRIPGPAWKEDRIVTRYLHRFQIIITEDYPYERPIVKWQTPVFHPNIMEPKDGGYVCTKLLDRWDFKSNLATFIKGIEMLLASPNPENPFGSDSCTRAAEYFRGHSYSPPSIRPAKASPRIVGCDGDG